MATLPSAAPRPAPSISAARDEEHRNGAAVALWLGCSFCGGLKLCMTLGWQRPPVIRSRWADAGASRAATHNFLSPAGCVSGRLAQAADQRERDLRLASEARRSSSSAWWWGQSAANRSPPVISLFHGNLQRKSRTWYPANTTSTGSGGSFPANAAAIHSEPNRENLSA